MGLTKSQPQAASARRPTRGAPVRAPLSPASAAVPGSSCAPAACPHQERGAHRQDGEAACGEGQRGLRAGAGLGELRAVLRARGRRRSRNHRFCSLGLRRRAAFGWGGGLSRHGNAVEADRHCRAPGTGMHDLDLDLVGLVGQRDAGFERVGVWGVRVDPLVRRRRGDVDQAGVGVVTVRDPIGVDALDVLVEGSAGPRSSTTIRSEPSGMSMARTWPPGPYRVFSV